MKRILALLFVSLPVSVLTAGGCVAPPGEPIEIADPERIQLSSSQTECDTDDDCFHTGCSNQLCASEDIITTCELTCEYGCYADASCGCKGKKCAFDHGPALAHCLAACKKNGQGGVPCGPNTCSGGQVCCNASCGICTPPGGVCIQIVCQ